MEKILIIIPTYNEAMNITVIINNILSLNKDYDILVIDDNSPDLTYDVVKQIDSKFLKILKRKNKMGLGSAYCDGFKYGLKEGYDKIIQIDADLSHDFKDIPQLLKYSNDYDLVIGSRYIDGVRVINWPISRLFLSYFANLYSRFIIGFPIYDSTGGFKCISSSVLSQLDLDNIKSEGYSFQIEVNFLAWIKKFKLKEVPIIFTDRTEGKSKMSKSIIFEAVFMVPFLRIKKIFNLID